MYLAGSQSRRASLHPVPVSNSDLRTLGSSLRGGPLQSEDEGELEAMLLLLPISVAIVFPKFQYLPSQN